MSESKLTECPRCFGNPAVVCCALCRDARVIPSELAVRYVLIERKMNGVDVGAAIRLRDQYEAVNENPIR